MDSAIDLRSHQSSTDRGEYYYLTNVEYATDGTRGSAALYCRCTQPAAFVLSGVTGTFRPPVSLGGAVFRGSHIGPFRNRYMAPCVEFLPYQYQDIFKQRGSFRSQRRRLVTASGPRS